MSASYGRPKSAVVLEPAEEALSFKDLLGLFGASKWLLLLIIAACTAISVVGLFLVQPTYEAMVLVSPVTDQNGSDHLGGLGSELGGLASLAGLATPNSSKKSESIAILQSELLTENYIRDNHLLPVLYASKWDAHDKRWKTDDPKKIPTLWKANRLFKDRIRRVSEDTKTGLVTVAITWENPDMAAKWANDLVRLTNDYARSKAIQNSERRIAFLTDQAANTSVLEVKASLYSLLEQELKQEMIARGTDEYALKVIDPAFVPEKPSYPIPALWIGLGVVSGVLIGIIYVLVRADWGAQRRAPP